MAEHKHLASIIGIILLILIMAGAVAYGVAAWRQSSINQLRSENQQLQTQLQQARSETGANQGEGQGMMQRANYQYVSTKGISVWVYTPSAESTVSSPLIIMGQVPGNWSFEAQFPVKIEDRAGGIIGQTPAKLQGSWMTSDLVPFTATVSFDATKGQPGTLVLQKDNPSGQPGNDDSVRIPINF